MSPWTNDELALAVKITSVQGRSFQETSEILIRHGYSQRGSDEIRDKIKADAPTAWGKIAAAREARKSSQICGVAAPAPKGRISDLPENFIEFVKTLPGGMSSGEACWAARQASFDCNVTDMKLAGVKTNYSFVEKDPEGIPYYEAIAKDSCLWPVGDGRACGAPRAVDRYCGAHHCRSLGDWYSVRVHPSFFE